MNSNYRYPSIGELWHFIFKCTKLSEGESSLQKRLNRLKNEESYSLKSEHEIKEDFHKRLSIRIGDDQVSHFVLEFIDELMMGYIANITEYMACYEKRENIKFLLCNGGISRIALSVCKFLSKTKKINASFGVDKDIFMPTITPDGVSEYPLKKMLAFLLKFNMTNKHKIANEKEESARESVRQYLSRLEKGDGGRRLNDLFDKLAPLLNLQSAPELESYLKFLVFISYTLENIYKKIEDPHFLEECVNEFSRQFENISKAMDATLYEEFSIKDIQRLSPEEWADVVNEWALFTSERIENYTVYLKRIIADDDFISIRNYKDIYYEENTEIRFRCYELFGEDAVHFFEWFLTNRYHFPEPEDFTHVDTQLNEIDKLVRLKADIESTINKMHDFMKENELWLKRYPWLSDELWAEIAYLDNDIEKAKNHIVKAFMGAKYSAGKGMHRIFMRAFELSVLGSDQELFVEIYKWGKYSKNIVPYKGIEGLYKVSSSDGGLIFVTDEDAFQKISEYYRKDMPNSHLN